ncbi:DUF2470 domain-containing protein [Streptomyces sp. MS1.AVA.1]|uniref:DUF2470 domain-containing protein n=1 Tax=Streptomyces machairae TaxID=3134109 RepID=A0ABU8USL4_9ACTN
MLGRLDAAHADTVAPLARLLPAREQLGAAGVRPLRLDRHGLVLRLETADSHHDVRLPFTTRPPTRETRCARSTRCSPGPPPARVAGACRPGRRRGHAPVLPASGPLAEAFPSPPRRCPEAGSHSRLPDSSRSVVRMSESVNGCRGSVRIRCAEPCSTSSPASSTAMR